MESDQHKGLVEGLRSLVPAADVRFCVRHLYANFRDKGFSGIKLKNKLWKAARAYAKHEHDRYMNEIKELNIAAFNYLNAIKKKMWCRSYFTGVYNCDLITNNICEAWNKYILDARDKPIVTMLELIRRDLMIRFQKKREMISRHISTCPNDSVLICPKIKEILNKNIAKIGSCCVHYAGGKAFQVDEVTKHYTLDLDNRHCDCGEWKLTGIPCRHACACIFKIREDYLPYVSECYHVSKYLQVYEDIIYPIPDPDFWETSTATPILPPKYKKQPGRPPKHKRKKGPESPKIQNVVSRKGVIMTCSKCKGSGHNKRGCKRPRMCSTQESVVEVNQVDTSRRKKSATTGIAATTTSTQVESSRGKKSATTKAAATSNTQAESSGGKQSATTKVAASRNTQVESSGGKQSATTKEAATSNTQVESSVRRPSKLQTRRKKLVTPSNSQ